MRRVPVLISLLLAACAPAAQTANDTPSSAAPASAPAAAAGLLGDYTVTLSESDFPPTTPAQTRNASVGTWAIAFHPGNHFVVMHNGRQVLEGPYQVSGNQVMFSTGESGPYACNTPVTYTWRVSGDQLTFTPVGQDACQGRALAITTRPLTRQP